jgi:hypothetical protein
MVMIFLFNFIEIIECLFRYNANLDDPYPRSSDKKRFITEGNITAQQCRSWFANRRQRLKHVKRNQPRTSRFHHSFQTR